MNPISKKLGLKPGMRALVVTAPSAYLKSFTPLLTVILFLRTHPLAEGTAHPRPAFPAPSTQPQFAFPRSPREQRSKSLGIARAFGGIELRFRLSPYTIDSRHQPRGDHAFLIVTHCHYEGRASAHHKCEIARYEPTLQFDGPFPLH